MSASIYAALNRQRGLMQEMQVVSNNLANSSTTGFKADRAVFAEFVVPTGPDTDSISMGGLAGHTFELTQGSVKTTGGRLDVAIQGDGYFVLQTDGGERLTRAGHFGLSAEGQLIDGNGNPVMGGGGPITIPPEATSVSIAGDGSISFDGQLIDRLRIVMPEGELLREGDTMFSATEGFVDLENASVLQGALEQSNVSPVLEISRMIAVQRAYEAGQTMLERNDQRLTKLLSTVRDS
ncbi:MAG: flagellar hook-basal body complex protein [Hyphomonas sp.]